MVAKLLSFTKLTYYLFGNNDIIIAGKSFSFAEEIILKAFI
jgi:hypothetical protein